MDARVPDRASSTSKSEDQTHRKGKEAVAERESTRLCMKCVAIPVEIFVPKAAPRSKPLPISFLTDSFVEPQDETGVDSLVKELAHSSSRDVLLASKEARYQHFEGEDALVQLKSASDGGCLLCATLYFSLQAQRHIRPSSTSWDNQALPNRLPTESGITLHSLDSSHFIVRDDKSRWSLVRFGVGDLVNEKGQLPSNMV
jgi:hypothetical protein